MEFWRHITCLLAGNENHIMVGEGKLIVSPICCRKITVKTLTGSDLG